MATVFPGPEDYRSVPPDSWVGALVQLSRLAQPRRPAGGGGSDGGGAP